MRISKIFYPAFLLIAFLSCQLDNSERLIKRVYIPEAKLSYIGTDSQARIFDRIMGLDSIRNGYDSFELRVSYSYGSPGSKDDLTRTLVIKNHLGKWKSEILKFKPDYPVTDSNFYSMYSERESIIPKSGWRNFMDSLFSYQLLKKPYEEIEEGKNMVHGPNGVTIEVATKSNYAEYSYYLPSIYQNYYWQIEDLKRIVALLEKELGFKLSGD